MNEFHRLPGATPQAENSLRRGELVVGIEVPPRRYGRRSHYLKFRDRASFAFACNGFSKSSSLNDFRAET